MAAVKGAAKMYQMMNKLEYGVMAKMDVTKTIQKSTGSLSGGVSEGLLDSVDAYGCAD